MAEPSIALVLEHLSNVQHSDTAIRRRAEILISSLLETNFEMAMKIMMHIVADNSISIYIRQLAVLIISQQVKYKFSSLNDDLKSQLLAFGVEHMLSGTSSIRNGLVNLIAKMAASSGRDEFNNFICRSSINIWMKSNDFATILLSFRCLCDISIEIGEGDPSRQLVLLQEAYSVISSLFQASSTFRSEVKLFRYASKFMAHCLQYISQARMSGGLDDEEMALLSQFLNDWCSVSLSWMCSSASFTVVVTTELGIYLEILRSLCFVLETFPDECADNCQPVVQCTWQLLIGIKGVYIDQFIMHRSSFASIGPDDFRDSVPSGYTSDGDRLDVEILVNQAFQLFSIGFSSIILDSKQTLFRNSSEFDAVLTLIIDFMQLTPHQRIQYFQEGNEFIANEQDEYMELNMRQNGAELMQEICHVVKDVAFGSLLEISQRVFQAFPQNEVDIIRFEAVLWSLGSVAGQYMKWVRKSMKKGNSSATPSSKSYRDVDTILSRIPPQSLSSFIFSLVAQSSNFVDESRSLLQPRLLWMASLYKDLLDVTQKLALVHHCVNLLGNASSMLPLSGRLQVCRAVGKFLQGLSIADDSSALGISSNENVRVLLEGTVRASLALLEEVNECTVHYPIETVQVIVKQHSLLLPDALFQEIIVHHVATLTKFQSDPMVLDLIHGLFKAAVKVPSQVGLVALIQTFLPYVFNLRDQNVNAMGLWQVCVDILGNMLSAKIRTPKLINEYEYLSVQTNGMMFLMSLLTHWKARGCSCDALLALKTALSTTYARFTSGDAIDGHLMAFGSNFGTSAIGYVTGMLLEYYNRLIAAGDSDASEGSENLRITEYIGPLMGLLCHLLLQFGDCIELSLQTQSIALSLTVLKMTSSSHVKCTILMFFVQLSAHNIDRVIQLVGLVQLQVVTQPDGQESQPYKDLFMELLTSWCSMHATFISRYCGLMSALGLIGLVRQFSANSVNHAHALYVLQVLLRSLPQLLIDEGRPNKQARQTGAFDDSVSLTSGHMVDTDDDDDGNDGDSDGEDSSEWGTNDGDDNCSGGGEAYGDDVDVDDDDAEGSSSNPFYQKNADNNPFAPAELYGRNHFIGGDDLDDNNAALTNVSDDLVFNPHRLDPLSSADLQQEVIDLLVFCGGGKAKLSFPVWFNDLSQDDGRLVKALLALK